MTGKELYELYKQASADEGCQVEELEDTGPMETKIWDGFALLVEASVECSTMTIGEPGLIRQESGC